MKLKKNYAWLVGISLCFSIAFFFVYRFGRPLELKYLSTHASLRQVVDYVCPVPRCTGKIHDEVTAWAEECLERVVALRGGSLMNRRQKEVGCFQKKIVKLGCGKVAACEASMDKNFDVCFSYLQRGVDSGWTPPDFNALTTCLREGEARKK